MKLLFKKNGGGGECKSETVHKQELYYELLFKKKEGGGVKVKQYISRGVEFTGTWLGGLIRRVFWGVWWWEGRFLYLQLFHVLYLDAWVLPWFALLEWVQQCRIELASSHFCSPVMQKYATFMLLHVVCSVLTQVIGYRGGDRLPDNPVLHLWKETWNLHVVVCCALC